MSHVFPRLIRGCRTTTLALFALVLLAPALHAAPQIVTVDSAGDVGRHTSLALNASGQPAVSYYDYTNADLKLATCTANCGSASPTWQIVTVDSVGDVGLYTSLALNASGQPVVSYWDANNGDLKLATCTANCATASPTWQIVTVDSGGDVGEFTSLALNTSGQPVVSYYDQTNGDLKLATCTANCATASPTWQIVTVDSGGFVGQHTSLAFNANGQPVVSYYDQTNGDLKLATCTANCATTSPTWQIVTIDSGGVVGLDTSLAFNGSGQPVVSYWDSNNGDLKLATCIANCATASPTWQIVTVASGGDVGEYTSLALTASGQPVVSYFDRTNGDLKLATCTANCATATPTWQILTIDSGGDVGRYTSLAFNASGQPVVSYYDATNGDLKLATILADFTVTASPNPATGGGLLTCAPTSGGMQAATATISDGQTASCIATPDAGYSTQSISGCSGTTTGVGVNSYTTGAVTANCTVAATFAPTTVGTCGSANGVASLVAPTANLCASGTASAVTTAAGSFNWTCSGSVAAITTDDASCSAPQQFTITTLPGAGGSVSCTPNPINSGGTSACTAIPLSGYTTQSISGCSGTTTGVGVNSYTTGGVAANCTVTATFAPTTVGTCGSANGVPTLVAPSANLCASGTASALTTAAGSFNWTCSGSVVAITTDDASCSATQQFTITSSPVGAGYLTCPTSTVNAGATVNCTATPFGDYITQSISGCGGTATGPGVNTFTTGAATANCTVSAVFVALQPVAVPTLNQWMLVVLAMLMLGVASRSALSLREPVRRTWPR